MYNTTLKNDEFLRITYKLMLKKIHRIQEINTHYKRDKLPLDLLKEKCDITSSILKALQELIKSLDYDKKDVNELADLLNEIGLKLSRGNISNENIHYDSAIAILEEFLD